MTTYECDGGQIGHVGQRVGAFQDEIRDIALRVVRIDFFGAQPLRRKAGRVL